MSDEKKSNTSQAELLAEKVLENSRNLAQKLPILGNVIWLYHQSANHRYMFFRDIEHRLMPALTKDQYKLYLHSKTGGLPMAFVSWAYLSDEAEQVYIQSQRIAPKDWDSGKNLWLIDAVTPFAEGSQLFQQVYEELFIDQDVYTLYPDENDKLQKITLIELASKFSEFAGKTGNMIDDPKNNTKH